MRRTGKRITNYKEHIKNNIVERPAPDYSGLTTPCWIWQLGKFNTGYGQLSYRGSPCLAHRITYMEFIGPIPDGLSVCHRCDEKTCCNPDHLFLGTHQDNMDDMYTKGRNSRARISVEERTAIRSLYIAGSNQASLAARFNRSSSMISRLVKDLKFHRKAA